MCAKLSKHFESRLPSDIRMAQIEFIKRSDNISDINIAIGNVSLPMHPAMIHRMDNLSNSGSPFADGVVKYSSTVGFDETQKAFLNIIQSGGFDTKNLKVQITDGGSAAMELVILGCCGAAGSDEIPLLLIDPAYTNYNSMADRVGRKTVSITRLLQDNGKFTLPNIDDIEKLIIEQKPGAMVVIPYDNPTGHFYTKEDMKQLAQLCVKYDMWMISDEAYRELHYSESDTISIWGITNKEVEGIEGRRISIETASKVWNACGLRIGAIVSDNQEFIEKSVAENTSNLCPNVIGQYIFGAIANISKQELLNWYDEQKNYYKGMLVNLTDSIKKLLPGIVVSSPDASIYSVVDVKNIVKEGFDAKEFVMWCAKEAKIEIDGKNYTLLVSPMAGFYSAENRHHGITQMRLSYVDTPDNMEKAPSLFAELLKKYEEIR